MKIPTKDIQSIYTEKLKSSDLTIEDAKKLGFRIIESPNDLEKHFYRTPAFEIPYHDQHGKATGFYRIRYLAKTNKGIMAATSAKTRRYDQPASEMPQLYLPKILTSKMTWKAIFDDPTYPLFITEGELKAACATKHGIPTMALGGVWNFKSKKSGLLHLPIFDEINLKGRKIYVIFDSDSATNPQVLFAQYAFCLELFHCGAHPVVINIPKIEDRKHGIDDYIVEYGIKAFKTLITDERNAEEFEFIRQLIQLNSEMALIVKPVSVVHFESGQLLRRQDAATLYANARMLKKRLVPAKKDDEEDTIKITEVATFDEWMQWEQRAQLWSMSYEPGQPTFVEINGKKHYNTWRGWGCEPEKGDISLWVWLLDNLLKDAEPTHRKWLEQWCAYPLQNPGVKMFSCPILFGRQKGTGKSLFGLTLLSIYGENGAEITNTELEDTRNVFAAQKQLILGNEVTGSDKRGVADRLKNLITQHTVTINKKYEPDYVVRDTINYCFTSNHADAIYMDNEERRFFVHQVSGPPLVEVSADKVRQYDAWLKSGAAARALFYHLLRVDLTGFDPFAPAPETDSKRAMVAASMSEIETWAAKLKEDPDTCLRVGTNIVKRSLFRVKELVAFYAPDSFRQPSDKAMSNALAKAGFQKAAKGQSCPTKDGSINLWLIRNEEMLTQMNKKQIGQFYDSDGNIEDKPKKFAKGAKK